MVDGGRRMEDEPCCVLRQGDGEPWKYCTSPHPTRGSVLVRCRRGRNVQRQHATHEEGSVCRQRSDPLISLQPECFKKR